jgi:hypothetical protein
MPVLLLVPILLQLLLMVLVITLSLLLDSLTRTLIQVGRSSRVLGLLDLLLAEVDHGGAAVGGPYLALAALAAGRLLVPVERPTALVLYLAGCQ